MTRSQFILGAALLCVSGTLAFYISFRDQEHKPLRVTHPTPSEQTVVRSQRYDRGAPLPLSVREIERIDPTHHEVTVSDPDLQEIGEKIQKEARKRLRDLTLRYQLSANQRREIFPLLVSHHPNFQDGLLANGSTALSPGETSLASQIYPFLDLAQQEAYQVAVLADNDWWSDIIGQLREDLDGALDAGEVDLITEPAETSPSSPDEGSDFGN
ncbi:hypothetical protein N9891_01000 [bacterium]|nr:hypothetical protein [bacterium]